ncbi:UBIQUITIN-CONJUGAT-2 domain-containing protein [Mycena kentingensis (nom. inval.)]|nr:UBIQUITIN-CONJUGAT-2 domain-containing protein [Mycena kentingensis (nom. inval.)]
MARSSSLLARLYRDLVELRESPYPGVQVFTGDELHKFCLVLTLPSGPWKNMSFHFDVELPEDWPTRPPRISISHSGAIQHPNLFGSYICCDLLKEEDMISRYDGYTGGYTPALTLRGLFLQFITFFSSTKIDQDYGGSPRDVGNYFRVWYARESQLSGGKLPIQANPNIPGSLYSYATQESLRREWEADMRPEILVKNDMSQVGALPQTTKAPRPHGQRLFRIVQEDPNWTRTLTRIIPEKTKPKRSPLSTPPPVCILDNLPDDILYVLASDLPSESVISFSNAYPRMQAVVQSMHVLLQRELRCFFLRTSLVDSVLGIGVAFDFRARRLSSDFDWLSRRAFAEFKVRLSIEKHPFDFFLPLAFSRQHFERVRPVIWSSLEEMDKEVRAAENKMAKNPRRRAPGPPRKEEMICVVYRLMNGIVVSLMQSCDDALEANGRANGNGRTKSLLHASEKAGFIQKKDKRDKTHVPDLGELIILIMLAICCPSASSTAPIKWSSLAGPFLEEAITRNVRWVLKDAPHLELLESGPSDFRLSQTFTRSRTSLRLIMFQITFLDLFFRAYASNLARLDDNYGFPDKELPEKMVEEIKAIYKVDSWPGFFTRVRFAQGVAFGKVKFSEMLRDAVKLSAERMYHTPARGVRQTLRLKEQRAQAEESARRQ